MHVQEPFLTKGSADYRGAIFALFFAGFTSFSLLHCVQPMMPVLADFFKITPTQSSFALSTTTFSLAFGLLFTGFISDAIGRKSIMVFALVSASLLTMLSSLIPSWSVFLISRIAVGLAVSGVAAVAMTYISEEVRPYDVGLTIGLYIAGTAIGGMGGRLFTGVLAEHMDWHMVLLLLGTLNLILAILFYFLLPESKHFKTTLFSLAKLTEGFKLHLKHGQLRILFVQALILMGCLTIAYNYLNYYLLGSSFAVSQSTLGILALAYLSGIYSSPRAAIWSERWGRKQTFIVMLLLMVTAIWLMAMTQMFWILCLGLLIFTASFFAAHSVASSWVSKYAEQQKAVATSLYLFCYYIGASVLGSSAGIVWESYNWIGITTLITIFLSIGIILATRLQET